ncbi:pyridoxine/pyridoxamine 5'-phosphate oxidase [Mycobacterium interjectum]|uniref:pyridoxine/pyridoxamine 5'-phosphate oxidase n=1 Tax=Mycobacterium interjectum TaxID=33895 RepID=UPI001F2405C0|nr:pyridoxal 5'-phosphate synthase [Mycobacterium interjectum]
MREFLRSLPVFAGPTLEFDTGALPDEPVELFQQWLREAVDEGVPEPHAMTLSTSDETGAPDARVLILKDLDEHGWWFATNSESVKGVQLAAQPRAALTFYRPTVARQIRVRGLVVAGSAQLSAADFRSRSTGARAVALASKESQPLISQATCAEAVANAERQLVVDPDRVASSWQVYALVAHIVEFWQADKDRMHTRVQYRYRDHWTSTLLWP